MKSFYHFIRIDLVLRTSLYLGSETTNYVLRINIKALNLPVKRECYDTTIDETKDNDQIYQRHNSISGSKTREAP